MDGFFDYASCEDYYDSDVHHVQTKSIQTEVRIWVISPFYVITFKTSVVHGFVMLICYKYSCIVDFWLI